MIIIMIMTALSRADICRSRSIERTCPEAEHPAVLSFGEGRPGAAGEHSEAGGFREFLQAVVRHLHCDLAGSFTALWPLTVAKLTLLTAAPCPQLPLRVSDHSVVPAAG